MKKTPLITKIAGTACCLLAALTSMADAREFRVDLGPTTSVPTGWNNIPSGAAGSAATALKDTAGTSSALSATILNGFWQGTAGAYNNNGTTTSTVYPAAATQDSFFIANTWQGVSDNYASIRLGGLNSTAKYTVRLYASRITTDTTDRTTLFTINGVSKELQVRNNVNSYVEFANLTPAAGNLLDVGVSIKAGASYGLLGLIQIIETIQTVALSPATETLVAKASTNPMGYVEYLPEGYNTRNDWPICIFLHGIGESVTNNYNTIRTLNSLAGFGPNSYASPKRGNHKLPMIILSPQSPDSKLMWDSTARLALIEQFRVYAFNKYKGKINTKRFYLTGLSMGGWGTSGYINNATYAPNVAAAVAICPANIKATGAANLIANKIPLWSAHAINDAAVPMSYTDNGFKQISVALGGTLSLDARPAGFTTVTAHFDKTKKKFVWEAGQQAYSVASGVPQYFSTVYSSGGHVIWDRMYQDPKVYTWMLQFSKP